MSENKYSSVMEEYESAANNCVQYTEIDEDNYPDYDMDGSRFVPKEEEMEEQEAVTILCNCFQCRGVKNGEIK